MGDLSRDKRPIVAITMGDGAGIGPEVILKSLVREDLCQGFAPLVLGDAPLMERLAKALGLDICIKFCAAGSYPDSQKGELAMLDWARPALKSLAPGRPDPAAARAAFNYIKKAVSLAHASLVDAIVTAPVNKKVMNEAGIDFPGHTEIIASLTGSEEFAMMLAWGHLRVAIATAHIPLKEVPYLLSSRKIESTIKLTHHFLCWCGIDRPRIAVAALNPHCGEGGLVGLEEKEIISPAIELAQAAGCNAEGPLPADSLFASAAAGRYDAVVAMYHDQGMMPVKLLSAGKAVNITLGIPIIRTSPDHGTAYDIAGRNCADESSMVEALKMAAHLARLRRGKGLAK